MKGLLVKGNFSDEYITIFCNNINMYCRKESGRLSQPCLIYIIELVLQGLNFCEKVPLYYYVNKVRHLFF